jgi:hypothetical protein
MKDVPAGAIRARRLPEFSASGNEAPAHRLYHLAAGSTS